MSSRAPDGPADAGVDEAVLVAGDVDRFDGWQSKVPFEVGVGEGRDEASRGGGDVGELLLEFLPLWETHYGGLWNTGLLLRALRRIVERPAQ